MTTDTIAVDEDLARQVTMRLVSRLESVALLVQAITIVASATIDKLLPEGRWFLYSVAGLHVLAAWAVWRFGSPFQTSSLWSLFWFGLAVIMPLVMVHLVGPVEYASSPACVQLCTYASPPVIMFAFYPWTSRQLSHLQLPGEITALAVLLLEPLALVLYIKDSPTRTNYISVLASATTVGMGYLLGKAMGMMCRKAAGAQLALKYEKDNEFFNFLHSHVRACINFIRAEHGPVAAGLTQLSTLDQVITSKRMAIQLSRQDVPLAYIMKEHVRMFPSHIPISVPSVGAMSVSGPVAKMLDRAIGDLLANIADHAQATAVDISFEVADDMGVLVISDDGIGFLASVLDDPVTSLGRLRADLRQMGGDLVLVSRPAPGAQLRLAIPLREPAGKLLARR